MVDAVRLDIISRALHDLRYGRLTTGTRQARAANAADERVMRAKTTHSIVVPEWPMNCWSGVSGSTDGMGDTWVGVAVGKSMAEVVLRRASTGSMIMATVDEFVGVVCWMVCRYKVGWGGGGQEKT